MSGGRYGRKVRPVRTERGLGSQESTPSRPESLLADPLEPDFWLMDDAECDSDPSSWEPWEETP